jgi:flagellin
MTSMLTNTAAMVALQTLRDINTNLDQTNNRVSTGLRVNNAADNAAYWSISTTIKSDNGALSAVTDSLSLGASTLSTTYTGLSNAITTLNDIKNQLTTATGANVDKTKVQQTIASDLAQLQSIAQGASFSGQNWLNTGSSTDLNKSIVSSVYRDANNDLQVGTIGIDITNTRLYANGAGLLDKTISLSNNAANTGTADLTGGIDFSAADDKVSFSVAVGGAPGTTVSITQDTVKAALQGSTTITSAADLAAVFNQALSDAGVTGVSATVDPTSSAVTFASLDTFTVGPASDFGTDTIDVTKLGLKATAETASAAGSGTTGSVDTLNITNATSTDIQAYLQIVDKALSEVTSAASQIGAVQNRVTSQQNFVKALSDANTTAVGALVDANMEEESTKLKALQTQQQLAVQSLSIANASTQNILTLFR